MPNKVILYVVAGCPRCFNAKRYLNNQHLEFQEFDVRKDHAKAKEMIEKSGQKSVPVFDINGTIIVGLQKDEILAALEK